jgi:ubiquinone biosynthesis protein
MALRHFGRLWVIARSLARHDALFLLELHPAGATLARMAKVLWRPKASVKGLRPGQRLALSLTALGPTFIKFGQALSTRADLLGEEAAADLAELQDRLPPFSFAEAKRTIEEDFEAPLESLYRSFDPAPVAAASIAQVHFAVDNDGREVAVKVIRPAVKAAFARDIAFLAWMAEVAESRITWLRRLKPIEVIRTFAETVRVEMDLRFEAASAQELAENFANDAAFRVPTVDWNRTSQRVLTLERVAGARVDDRAAVIAMGADPVVVVKAAAEAFFKMVFRDGFFHADMHPGNLFIAANGVVIAVDFGIMGRIDAETRLALGEMLLGFLTRDYRRVADVHIRAGYVPAHKSVENFAQAARTIAEPIFNKPIAQISIAKLLGQLFQITEDFEMETQPQLLLLQKSMLLAEGVGRRLAPEVNMWELARPLVEGWMRERLGPAGKTADMVGETIATVQRLPRIIERVDSITADLARNGLKLHPDTTRVLRGEGRRRVPVMLWLPWVVAAVLLGVVVLR